MNDDDVLLIDQQINDTNEFISDENTQSMRISPTTEQHASSFLTPPDVLTTIPEDKINAYADRDSVPPPHYRPRRKKCTPKGHSYRKLKRSSSPNYGGPSLSSWRADHVKKPPILSPIVTSPASRKRISAINRTYSASAEPSSVHENSCIIISRKPVAPCTPVSHSVQTPENVSKAPSHASSSGSLRKSDYTLRSRRKQNCQPIASYQKLVRTSSPTYGRPSVMLWETNSTSASSKSTAQATSGMK
jgi:hypothetical protein